MSDNLHPDLSIIDWPFEDLVKQFGPLLHKYSCYYIANHDYDDLRQELLVLLHR